MASGEVRTKQILRTLAAGRRFVYAVLLTALITIIGVPVHLVIDPVNLVMFYLAGVVVAALYLGRGPAILASVLGVLAFDFFFISPRLTLSVDNTQHLLTFFGLLVVGLIISSLTAQVKTQMEEARQRAAQIAALYDFSRSLATAGGCASVVQVIVEHFRQAFGGEAAVLLPDGNGILEVRAASAGGSLSAVQLAAAAQVYEGVEGATQGMLHLPLTTTRGVVGVISIQDGEGLDGQTLAARRSLLEAHASLAALALERALLAEQANQMEMHRATERLQTALLNSISHDLRTPLATITGALDSILEVESGSAEGIFMEQSARIKMIESARGEAQRLNRLVGDLLDMTRLESGSMHLHLEETDVEDLIGAALSRFDGNPARLRVDLPADLPLVRMDYALIEQVLMNLLDNAAKYAPPGTPIEVSARLEGEDLLIAVADRGPGIPEADIPRIFDKFFRIQRPNGASGTGLGLSICKGIIEAHGGSIRAENRPQGGACLTFSIPLRPPAATNGGTP